MKIYFFREWSSFDCGGMDVEEFCTLQELNEFLLASYPNGIPKDVRYKIIEGHERTIFEKDITVVKKYDFSS